MLAYETKAELYLDEDTIRTIRTIHLRERGRTRTGRLEEATLDRKDGKYYNRKRKEITPKEGTALLNEWLGYPVKDRTQHCIRTTRVEIRYL